MSALTPFEKAALKEAVAWEVGIGTFMKGEE